MEFDKIENTQNTTPPNPENKPDSAKPQQTQNPYMSSMPGIESKPAQSPDPSPAPTTNPEQNMNRQYNQNMQAGQNPYTNPGPQYGQPSQNTYNQGYNPNMGQPNYNSPYMQNQYQNYGSPYPYNNGFNMQPEKKSSGLSIASMVLGIISIVTFCYFIVSIPCGVLGLIFGIVAKSKGSGGQGMALAGIITSSIGLLITVLFMIYAIAVGQASSSYMTRHQGFSQKAAMLIKRFL